MAAATRGAGGTGYRGASSAEGRKISKGPGTGGREEIPNPEKKPSKAAEDRKEGMYGPGALTHPYRGPPKEAPVKNWFLKGSLHGKD